MPGNTPGRLACYTGWPCCARWRRPRLSPRRMPCARLPCLPSQNRQCRERDLPKVGKHFLAALDVPDLGCAVDAGGGDVFAVRTENGRPQAALVADEPV